MFAHFIPACNNRICFGAWSFQNGLICFSQKWQRHCIGDRQSKLNFVLDKYWQLRRIGQSMSNVIRSKQNERKNTRLTKNFGTHSKLAFDENAQWQLWPLTHPCSVPVNKSVHLPFQKEKNILIHWRTDIYLLTRCLLTTIADSNPANVIFGKSRSFFWIS
mgnify:CR=1 FL=1